MPVTIDIREDLRYQQGVEEEKVEVAENLLKEGLTVLFIQKITGLPTDKIEEIAQKLERE